MASDKFAIKEECSETCARRRNGLHSNNNIRMPTACCYRDNKRCRMRHKSVIGHRTFAAIFACFLTLLLPPTLDSRVGVAAASTSVPETRHQGPTAESLDGEAALWETDEDAEDLVSTKDPCKARPTSLQQQFFHRICYGEKFPHCESKFLFKQFSMDVSRSSYCLSKGALRNKTRITLPKRIPLQRSPRKNVLWSHGLTLTICKQYYKKILFLHCKHRLHI